MKTTILKMLEKLGEDVDYYEYPSGNIEITINDFEGFTDDYDEIFRDYNEIAVEELLEWLKQNSVQFTDDYYLKYTFEGFIVTVGYRSYDI